MTDNLIIRIPTPKPDVHGTRAAMHVNSNTGEKIYGLEAAVEGMIPGVGRYGLNAGWKDGANEATDKDLVNFAHFTANAWCNWQPTRYFAIAPIVQYVSERKGYSIRQVNNADVGSFTLDAYVLLSVNAHYSWRKWTLSLTGKNLLNERYTFPEYVRTRSEETPGGPDRSMHITLRYETF